MKTQHLIVSPKKTGQQRGIKRILGQMERTALRIGPPELDLHGELLLPRESEKAGLKIGAHSNPKFSRGLIASP